MNLLLKFNLAFLGVFLLGLGGAAWVSRSLLMRNAEEQVVQNARIMMETAMSMRTYTVKRVRPLVQDAQKRMGSMVGVLESALDEVALVSTEPAPTARTTPRSNGVGTSNALEAGALVAVGQARGWLDGVFHPETVPAFGATEAFTYLRAAYPDYTYKEATLNPTNPRDRATDWETDVVTEFRTHPERTELIGKRETPTGPALYLARPIKVDAESCLDCHSTPDRAPAAMIKEYGPANGFGWKLNEVIGAQIVSVPTALPVRMAESAFEALIGSLAAVLLVTLGVLNAIIYVSVVQPIGRLTAMADEVSKGNFSIAELPAAGSDEIGSLTAAFNRMRRSLEKAMKMLDG